MINVHPNLTGSSILHEAEGPEADGEMRRVPMCRLDDLIENYNLQGELLLKLDVQGAELEVLEGAARLLPLSDVLILEVAMFRFF
jgi:FkbM family methyltransferase